MACDIAEVVGAALGLNLLFGIPLLPGRAASPGSAPSPSSPCSSCGFRRLEAGITVLVGVVVASFVYELFDASPDGGEIAKHLFVPGFAGTESILLATGIIGATVMPHVDLPALGADPAADRRPQRGREKADPALREGRRGDRPLARRAGQPLDDDRRRRPLQHQRADRGRHDRRRLRGARQPRLRTTRRPIFGIALLASGFASSSVGTMAGQVVMQGFIRRESRSSCGAR